VTVLRAGEVAGAAGVNIQTLRYYERRGFLPEPPRSNGGHRRYGHDVVWVGSGCPRPPSAGSFSKLTSISGRSPAGPDTSAGPAPPPTRPGSSP
jgi:hypothetical protein